MSCGLLCVMEMFLEPGFCFSRVKTVHVLKNYRFGRSPHGLGQAYINVLQDDLYWPFLQIADSLGASRRSPFSLKHCWGWDKPWPWGGSFVPFGGVVPSVRLLWCVSLNYENKWKLTLCNISCNGPLRWCHSLGITELKSVFDADPWRFSISRLKGGSLWKCEICEGVTWSPRSEIESHPCHVPTVSFWADHLTGARCGAWTHDPEVKTQVPQIT